MSIKEHLRTNIFLAVPVMLSQLGHVMMGVTDNIMVGHLGATQLAGASLANVIFNVLLLFGIGVSYAMTPLIAEADGKRDDATIVNSFRHGFIINLIFGFVLVLAVIAGKNLMYSLDQPEEVVQEALPFLSIITYSLIPVLIFQSFRQFADGLSLTYLSLVIMIAANVLNIILNYAFVYGHFGFEPMGLVGSGYATLTSRIFMAVALGLYVFYHAKLKKYRAAFLFKDYSWKYFKTLLMIGLPAGAQFVFEVAAFDFSAVMMGWFGTNTLAAHQIAINLATISYMTTSGLSAAAVIRIGNFIGQRDSVNLKRSVYTLLGLALALMTLFGIVFLFGRFWLPSLYINDLSVITIAGPLVVIAALFQLSDGVQVVCSGALRGLQDVKIPSLFIFISYWVIGLPLGYWLAFTMDWGPNGIWIGLLIGLTLVAIALFVRLRRLMNTRISNAMLEIEKDNGEVLSS